MILRSLALLVAAGFGSAAAPFSDVYFFGDSLTDTGNIFTATRFLNFITLGAFPVTPGTPYFQGRFSNGPVWAEFTASRLGFPNASTPAGMILGDIGSVPGDGNNYAIGGARTAAGGALGSFDAQFPTGVFIQTIFHQIERGFTADPTGLYFLTGGGNDLRDAAKISDLAQRQAAAELAADYMAHSIIGLYLAGARNFVLLNAPNVGNTPESRVLGNSATGRQVTDFFNNRLNFYSTIFQSIPGMWFEYFDLFDLFEDVYADTVTGGTQFGFTNATVPCFAGFAGSTGRNCNTSLFADDIHPTSRLHGIVGNRVADQVLARVNAFTTSLSGLTASGDEFAFASSVVAIPEPGTFVGAGLVIIAMAGWRRRSRNR